MMKSNRIGFMQGRLSPVRNGVIQEFPKDHWQNEIKIAHSIGFDLMEWTIDFEGLMDNPLMTSKGQEEIKLQCDQNQLDILSVTGDHLMQRPFYKETSEDQKNHRIEELKTLIQSCGNLGIEHIVFPVVDQGEIQSDEQNETLLRELNRLQSFLSENRVKIIFETEKSPEQVSKWIQNFDSKLFGINYDIGNSAGRGHDPEEEFDLYFNRIQSIHIKDRILGGTTVPLGEGSADLPKVFKLLKKHCYQGRFVLQAARAENGDHKQALTHYRNQVMGWMEC